MLCQWLDRFTSEWTNHKIVQRFQGNLLTSSQIRRSGISMLGHSEGSIFDEFPISVIIKVCLKANAQF